MLLIVKVYYLSRFFKFKLIKAIEIPKIMKINAELKVEKTSVLLKGKSL